MFEPLLPPWLAAWGAALTAVASVVLSSLSALLERSGPIRLRHWAEEAGGALQALYGSPRRFETYRFFLSFLAKVAPLLVLGFAAQLLSGLAVIGAPLWALAVVVALVTASEGVNRALVELHSEASLRRLTWPYRIFHTLLSPLIWLLAHYAPHADANDENGEVDDEASEGEIKAFIDVGRREGILEPEEEQLLRSLVDFGDTQVRRAMTPRVDMVCASVTSSLEEIATVFLESKHSRLPLYRESIDQIVGILHIRDLFESLHNDGERELVRLSKPPHFIPESKSLRQLLAELQGLRQQLAIVVDEYGGVAGLITVEDLLEEIVGDIGDEHEEDESRPERLPDGSWRVEGRAELDELTELFGVALSEVPYETVSGLICGQLGYVPKVGEAFEMDDLRFSVEGADERRVLSVRVRRQDLGQAEAGAEPE